MHKSIGSHVAVGTRRRNAPLVGSKCCAQVRLRCIKSHALDALLYPHGSFLPDTVALYNGFSYLIPLPQLGDTSSPSGMHRQPWQPSSQLRPSQRNASRKSVALGGVAPTGAAVPFESSRRPEPNTPNPSLRAQTHNNSDSPSVAGTLPCLVPISPHVRNCRSGGPANLPRCLLRASALTRGTAKTISS
jgi:hypothetical protein